MSETKTESPMYVLAPNEKLIFELNIDEVSLKATESAGIIGELIGQATSFITNILKTIFPSCCQKPGEGLFVVTNSRCLIVFREKIRGFMGFNKSEIRNFLTFPRDVISEWHSYEKVSNTSCWCCTGERFKITMDIYGAEHDLKRISFCSHDITSDEEAQALISTLIELSQKS